MNRTEQNRTEQNRTEQNRTECSLCQLSKVGNGKFKSLHDSKLTNIGANYCGTITARYYKGIGANGDNMILEENISMCDYRYDEGIRERKTLVCPTLCSSKLGSESSISGQPFVLIRQNTKEGSIPCKVGGVADFRFPSSKTRRGRVQDNGDVSPTIISEGNGICKIESDVRIRRLTPLECWRLMGYKDEDFQKAKAVNSDTQLYKEAGNAIVKQVLEAIFKSLIE